MEENLILILSLILIVIFIKKRFFDTKDYNKMLNNGGIIIDVRSEHEFMTGNIEGSINIPLSNLTHNLKQLKDKDQTIITCCASGKRSAKAKKILKSEGYKNVFNGGGWKSLNKKIK